MDDEVLVDEATEIFPKIGKLFYAGMMHQLQSRGCTLGQMKVMGHLYTYGRGTISEVAGSVGVSLPTASELVEQLDEKGWLARKVNPADRRQVLVELTPQARAHAEEWHEIRRGQVRAALMRLAPAERPVFVRSLKALADVLGESVARPAETPVLRETSKA
ncbi:MAG: MarR family winged helix-turn-helix transcriptional regulator [Thermomicrobiales bacterium]|jgi:DNA-binding MarR family transcriptional regulator